MQFSRILFFLSGLCFSISMSAQESSPFIDSLVQTIYQAESEEEKLEQYRVTIVNALSRDTARVAPLLAELKVLAEPADAHLAKARYHFLTGEYQNRLGAPGSPTESLLRSTEEYLLAGDTMKSVDVSGYLMNLYKSGGEYEQLDRLLEKLTELLQVTRDSEARAIIALILGMDHIRTGKLEEARSALKKGLAAAEQGDHGFTECQLLIKLGNINRESNPNDAILLLERAAARAEEIGEYGLVADACSRLFEVYNFQKNFSEAIRMAEKALDASDRANNANYAKHVRFTVQNNLGLLYTDLKDYESARSLFEEIIEGNQKSGDPGNEFVAHINYGLSLQAAGDTIKADQIYRRAVEIVRDIPNPRYQHAGYYYYADFLHKTNRIEEALPYIEDAFALNERVPPKSRMDLDIVRANYALSNSNFNEAVTLAEKVLQFSIDGGLDGMVNDAHEVLARAHHKLGNYATAFDYLKQRSEDLEERQEEEQIGLKNFVTGQLNRSFEQERRVAAAEQERDLAVARAQTTQTRWIASGIGLLALGALAFFLQGRRTNRIISQRNHQLAVANQTKDRLFGIVGHDLRSPALSFRGITEKVRYLIRERDFDRLDKLGVLIERNAGALHQLTDNLLNWALSQRDVLPHRPGRLDLGQLAREIVELYTSVAQDRGVQLQLDIPAGQYVYADADTLRAILRNLIDNAIKFTPAGGTVSVSSTPTQNGLQLAVRDTGMGIPADKLDEIFLLTDEKVRPDQQGKRSTGLGLHLVQELVRRNQGHIDVNSAVGRGTTFEVQLPVAT